MIIGIWRAPRELGRPLEDYVKFQNDVVVPEFKTMKGSLGIFNFHTDTEWGTVQFWESLDDDIAEDTSPQTQRISERLRELNLLPGHHGDYEWFEFHNGFTHQEALKKFIG